MARKKVLMVASVASMIGQFSMDSIVLLQELGYEVHVACNFDKGSTWKAENSKELKKRLSEIGVKTYQIDFSRKPLEIGIHRRAYKQLKKVIEENKYDFAHCHSPIGGAITRLVCKKVGVKCIYTAHGFHFYKGAPIQNWLLFYPIEKYFSKYTDTLITINQEDYQIAKKRFKAKRVEYVPGIGVSTDISEISEDEKAQVRASLGVKKGQTMLLSVGELNENKNHMTVIEALHKINDKNIKYFICGNGNLKDNLQKKISEYGLEDNIKLLGFRNDIAMLNMASDLYVFPSFREGLSVALMEAMLEKNLVVCSRIRGNVDLIQNEHYLFNPENVDEVVKCIKYALNNSNREKDIMKNHNNIVNNFSAEVVRKKICEIYTHEGAN